MKYNFIFDVDGTLTPSRQQIDGEFYKFFLNFCRNNIVFLVTGSDREKTLEQLTPEIYNSCHTVFNCSGNDIWQGNRNIYTNNWVLPEAAHTVLSQCLTESGYAKRTGNHFEHRPGSCNFSIVGRNATLEDRSDYKAYDSNTKERDRIANVINLWFPDIIASVGGEISIDVFEKGRDKSQIINQFDASSHLVFFGDQMGDNGNDYTLSQEVKNRGGVLFHVKDYKDTWSVLQNMFSQ
jgi:phosphomannomutase